MSIHHEAPGGYVIPLCAFAKNAQGKPWSQIVLDDVEDGFLVADDPAAVDCSECIEWERA